MAATEPTEKTATSSILASNPNTQTGSVLTSNETLFLSANETKAPMAPNTQENVNAPTGNTLNSNGDSTAVSNSGTKQESSKPETALQQSAPSISNPSPNPNSTSDSEPAAPKNDGEANTYLQKIGETIVQVAETGSAQYTRYMEPVPSIPPPGLKEPPKITSDMPTDKPKVEATALSKIETTNAAKTLPSAGGLSTGINGERPPELKEPSKSVSDSSAEAAFDQLLVKKPFEDKKPGAAPERAQTAMNTAFKAPSNAPVAEQANVQALPEALVENMKPPTDINELTGTKKETAAIPNEILIAGETNENPKITASTSNEVVRSAAIVFEAANEDLKPTALSNETLIAANEDPKTAKLADNTMPKEAAMTAPAAENSAAGETAVVASAEKMITPISAESTNPSTSIQEIPESGPVTSTETIASSTPAKETTETNEVTIPSSPIEETTEAPRSASPDDMELPVLTLEGSKSARAGQTAWRPLLPLRSGRRRDRYKEQLEYQMSRLDRENKHLQERLKKIRDNCGPYNRDFIFRDNAKFAKLRSFQPRETMHQREEARIEKSNKALQDHIAGIKTKPGPYNRDVLLDEFERVLSM